MDPSQFHYCPKEGSEPYTGHGASLEKKSLAEDGQSLQKLIGAYYIDIHWESYWSYWVCGYYYLVHIYIWF